MIIRNPYYVAFDTLTMRALPKGRFRSQKNLNRREVKGVIISLLIS